MTTEAKIIKREQSPLNNLCSVPDSSFDKERKGTENILDAFSLKIEFIIPSIHRLLLLA